MQQRAGGREAAWKALASECRRQILRRLTEPAALREILVFSEDGPSCRPPRPLARQSVQKHLARLQEAGLVRSAEGDAKRYVVDGPGLYGALEEMRELAHAAAAAPAYEAEARPLEHPVVSPTPPDCAHLVLVRGVPEGRVMPLDGDRTGWRLGRTAGNDLDLCYDPYVSRDHCRIRCQGGDHVLEPSPSARNGTSLDFRRIDGPVVLRSGSIIGVGRTLLVYREADKAAARFAARPATRPKPA